MPDYENNTKQFVLLVAPMSRNTTIMMQDFRKVNCCKYAVQIFWARGIMNQDFWTVFFNTYRRQ